VIFNDAFIIFRLKYIHELEDNYLNAAQKFKDEDAKLE
jgi:hypothetical protein